MIGDGDEDSDGIVVIIDSSGIVMVIIVRDSGIIKTFSRY
jgi:hypothetical protein